MSYVLGAFAAKKEEEKERMALRDYFAAKAMQGLLTHNAYISDEELAQQSYAIANAMLKARGEE